MPGAPSVIVSTARRISGRLRKLSASRTSRSAARCHLVAVPLEAVRLGVAEAEDRLVDVAHGIEAVRPTAPAPAAAPVARWCPETRPSGCGRTAPATRARASGCRIQQPDREFLQIGEIERAGLPFAFAIDAVEAAQQFEQRAALGRVIVR